MKKTAIVYLTVILSLLSVTTFAQTNSGLLTTLTAVAGMRERLPVEKLYLQLDKPYYALGDTLHFKAYLLNGDFLKPSIRSGLMYIELADALNKVVKRITVRVVNGTSVGEISLKGKDIPQGSYALRAYTSWMKNFGDDYIFKKSLYFSSVNGNSTLVKTNFKLENDADKDKVTANIRFTGLDGQPRQQKSMLIRIKQNDKTLFKENYNTDSSGRINLNFDVAAKAAIKNVIIQAQDISKGADTTTLIIPLHINRVENTDLQFMPEGGNMVAGIPTKIGFKAIDDDGKGIAINGKIVNNKQQEVTSFQSTHLGMGSFELTPLAGEVYTAKVTLPGNITKSYPLPTVNPAGTTLKVNLIAKDQLEVTLSATPALVNTTYYLIGITRGVVCYSAAINFKEPVVKKSIAIDMFPTGIAHFTLFNSANQPLNERIVYIDHNDNLQLSISSNKLAYTLRDSIGLNLQAKDKYGKPVRGNFSIAVTDDSQVNGDSLGNNIISSLLLTSDLKGTVEEPNWYFEKYNNTNSPPDGYRDNKAIALDNLLLTQGWVGYDWKQVFAPPVNPEYEAEPEFKVKGRVSTIINKPVANTEVMLISTQPELLLNTKTDKDGHFTFSTFPPLDTINFRLQTKRTFNIGLVVDEFIPPELTPAKDMPAPWYVNTDSIKINYAHKKKMEWDETFDARNTMLLKQVEIKAKQPVRLAFDEPVLQLNEEEIRNARPGKKPFTLHDLLNQEQDLSQMHLRLVVDGQMATHLQIPHTTQLGVKYDIMKEPPPEKVPDESPEVLGLLDRLTTEDIKGFSAKKILVPELIIIPFTDPPIGIVIVHTYLQVSVTTNTKFGNDAIPAGDYVYRPMPISWPHQFYSPRYTVNTAANGKDRRSTIFWAPDIVTDANGKASTSFYSADLPGTYTLIIEGTDMNGNFGYSRQKIKVVSTAKLD